MNAIMKAIGLAAHISIHTRANSQAIFRVSSGHELTRYSGLSYIHTYINM